MQLFRSHGITRNTKLMTKKSQISSYYEQRVLGFNYRMNDLQAALGISQMKRLDMIVAKRHVLQKNYHMLLDNFPIIKPYQDTDNYSSLHLYPIQIDLKKINKNRNKIFEELRNNGIGVNIHYIPIHTQPYYRKLGFKKRDFPNAVSYYTRAISLPLHNKISIDDQRFIIKKLKYSLYN